MDSPPAPESSTLPAVPPEDDANWRPPAHVERIRRRLRYRANWPLRWTILAMFAALTAYVLIDSYLGYRRAYGDFTLHLIHRLGGAFFIVWIGYLGGSIGSFLNVVAYRLPRGMPLNGRSKCPYCNTQILARHNLPVLGWLALRGRCYTCRLPISPRYPIVEAFVAFCFLWVGWHEIYNNIANLPLEQVARRQSALAIFRPTPFTIGIGSFHLLGITCLVALGLTRLDGQKLPSKLIGFALGSALIPVLIWPRLLQVPATLTVPDGWNPQKADLGDAVMFQICSLAMSVFLAKLIGIGLLPTANLKFDPQLPDSQRLLDLVAGLSLCGLLVGWQATLAVTPWAPLIAWLISHYSPGTRRFDIVGRLLLALALAVTLQIAHWYGLSQLPVWPFPDHSQWSYVLPIAATMLLTRIPWPAPTSAPWHANSSSLATAAANHPAAMLAESTGPDEAEVDESTH